MDPRDFLALARKLGSATAPAELRTAISRAYYSVFNIACETIRNLGCEVSRGSDAHGYIRSQLSNCSSDELKKAGVSIGTLHNHRIRADYELQECNVENPNTARLMVKLADMVISTLDSHVREKAKKEQFKRSLREYEQKITQHRKSH